MDTVSLAILIIVLCILVAAVIAAAISYTHFYKYKHFRCPKCNHCFKPPVLKMIFSVNAVDGKIIRCPKCGEREYMEPEWDDGAGDGQK